MSYCAPVSPISRRRGLAALLLPLPLLAAGLGCHRGGSEAAVNANAAPAAKGPAATAQAPLPPLPPLPPGGVKGIYLTGWTAGSNKGMTRLVGLADRTEINAMVIDVKDDGQVSYETEVPLAQESKAVLKMYDVDKVIATCNKHHIWPIARIACMRDGPLAKAHPELAVHGPDGQVWHDRSKHYWLNPYKKEVWDYNVDIALDAIKHGFKEVQFDYVRFPSEGKISTLQYPGKPAGARRADQILAFLKYAEQKIHAQGAYFSADVFGLTSTVERRYDLRHKKTVAHPASEVKGGPPTYAAGAPTASVAPAAKGKKTFPPPDDKIAEDMGIGQKFSKMAQHVNYMCPMVYPSHYAHGEFGIANPNAEPYKIIMKSVGDSKALLTDAPNCKLRPWIQDFSLGQPHYGPTEVKAQIKALNDLGVHEFLLWNANCRYTEAAFAKEPASKVASQ